MKDQLFENFNHVGEGFNFALFLTPPRNREDKDSKELEEELDRMTFSLSLDKNVSSLELSKNPSEIANYINKDLLHQLEQTSPMKSVISLKNQTNISLFKSNELNERYSDNGELLNNIEGISPYNVKSYNFDDEKNNNPNIKPIKFNQFEQREINSQLSRKDDNPEIEVNSSISTNHQSKYSSINSPNFYSNDFHLKSLKAESNLYNSYQETLNKYSMFNLKSQILNQNHLSESKFILILGPLPIKNLNFTNNKQILDYPQNNNNYQQTINLQNQQRINFNYNLGYKSNINQNHLNNINNFNKKIEKKKKVFEERAGDWVCMKCKNLNFSFRMICNRCKIPKIDSEKLYDEHIKNLCNYVKINEMYQNQVFSQNFNNVTQNSSNNFQQNHVNNSFPNKKVNSQTFNNQNCINLSVYSNEIMNNGYN